MSVWNYERLAHPFHTDETAFVMDRRTCLFCKHLLSEELSVISHLQKTGGAIVRLCANCGWWYVKEEDSSFEHPATYGGFANLRPLDLKDLSTPIDEVAQYLIAKYDARATMSPRLLEETVAAVFSGLGYSTRLGAQTANGADNGIDVYLDGPGDSLVGIQVKRQKRPIEISQIHSLCGALITGRCTKGVYVTTSKFRRGAVTNADDFQSITGVPIELIDADDFYDRLGIFRRTEIFDARDPEAPWNQLGRPYMWTE
jgi:restriction system protein